MKHTHAPLSAGWMNPDCPACMEKNYPNAGDRCPPPEKSSLASDSESQGSDTLNQNRDSKRDVQ